MSFIPLRKQLWAIGSILLALPMYCWLQWQPKAWFDEQLAAQPMHVGLHYETLQKSFPGLLLSRVRINTPGIDTLRVDALLLRPAFLSLLSGGTALFVHAEGNGMSAESVIDLEGSRLSLSDVAVQTSAASLSRLDPRLLLLGLQGNLKLQGHMQLQAVDGLPLNGDMTLVWNNPSSTLLPSGMHQLRLTLTSTDMQSGSMWIWKLASQPDDILGRGTIMGEGPDIRQWLLSGSLRTARDSPDLILSGSLGALHWQ